MDESEKQGGNFHKRWKWEYEKTNSVSNFFWIQSKKKENNSTTETKSDKNGHKV